MPNRELRRERILFNREKAIKVIIIMMRMMVMMTETVIMIMMGKRVMMKMTTIIKGEVRRFFFIGSKFLSALN